MKQFLFLFFVLIALGYTQVEAHPQGDEFMYNIQLNAVEEPNLEDYESVKKYGFLHLQPNDMGSKYVMLGTFTSGSHAKAVLAKVQAKGYSEAIVQKTNLNPTNLVYTIQLGSYSYTSGLHFTKYAAIEDLRVNASVEGVKLSAGAFNDKESAQKSRNEIKAMGHSCFVVQVNEDLLLYPSKHNFHTAELLAEREAEKFYNSDVFSSKEYRELSIEEQKRVVLLDNRLSIEHNGKFISLEAYQKTKSDKIIGEKPKPKSSPNTTPNLTKTKVAQTPVTSKLPKTSATSEGQKVSALKMATNNDGTKKALAVQTSTSKAVPATAVNTATKSKAATAKTTTASGVNTDRGIVQSRSTERPPLPPGLTARGVTVKNDFRIQITAVQYMDPLVFRPLEPYGTFSIEKESKGITRVMLGNYQSLSEAREILKEVQKQGYKQAFILVYENGFRTGRVE